MLRVRMQHAPVRSVSCEPGPAGDATRGSITLAIVLYFCKCGRDSVLAGAEGAQALDRDKVISFPSRIVGSFQLVQMLPAWLRLASGRRWRCVGGSWPASGRGESQLRRIATQKGLAVMGLYVTIPFEAACSRFLIRVRYARHCRH